MRVKGYFFFMQIFLKRIQDILNNKEKKEFCLLNDRNIFKVFLLRNEDVLDHDFKKDVSDFKLVFQSSLIC